VAELRYLCALCAHHQNDFNDGACANCGDNQVFDRLDGDWPCSNDKCVSNIRGNEGTYCVECECPSRLNGVKCALPPHHGGFHQNSVRSLIWPDNESSVMPPPGEEDAAEELPVRAESGPIQFGDDWTGVFLRGDDAFAVAISLQAVLDDDAEDATLNRFILEPFLKLLKQSNHSNPGRVPPRLLRSFQECLKK
jgi:hypothetical protein